MDVKVNIVASLKTSCYNCELCKEKLDDDTGNSGHYFCQIDKQFIGDFFGGEHLELPCNGMFWKWDGDDRGQKTLEDCSNLKVVDIR